MIRELLVLTGMGAVTICRAGTQESSMGGTRVQGWERAGGKRTKVARVVHKRKFPVVPVLIQNI